MTTSIGELQKQLLGAFFEESFEGVERLEAGLLTLARSGADDNLINDIFRAAHSIKGASGTFGFASIAALAHTMETLLDRIRAGTLAPRPEISALLLEGVDALRTLLQSATGGDDPSLGDFTPLQQRLEKAMRETAPVSSAPALRAGAPLANGGNGTGWRIEFRPLLHLLRTGNDPLRLFRELARLGTLTTEADLAGLPPLAELDPTSSHLQWTLTLAGDVARHTIEEIFSWVDGDCELRLTPLSAPAAAPRAEADPLAVPPRTEPDQGLGSIRVGVEKIDLLMNMVGELVITQSMLGELDAEGPVDAQRLGRIREGLSQLARNTRALQESVMRLRSMPISIVFNRFPRLVHDVCQRLGKQVELRISGETTELDKTVLEKLGDPLVHLVRNSLDHGIETADERLAAGKPAEGTLQLCAYHRGSDIVVEVTDDGRGIDPAKVLRRARERGLVGPDETPTSEAILELIFAPGFSTAETVSDISGRGVGMDVVRRNVRSLSGSISIDSALGRGTKIVLRLPLTLAITDGQLIRLGPHSYILPLLSIVESVQVEPARVKRLLGQWSLYRLREHLIPIIDLATLFSVPSTAHRLEDKLLVVVETEGQRLGLLVDELQGQQQVVVKSLEANYGQVEGLAGATILGDGSVAFIVDVTGIGKLLRRERGGEPGPVGSAAA